MHAGVVLLGGLVATFMLVTAVQDKSGIPPTFRVSVDAAIGVLACLALVLRRRWPTALALVLIGAGLLSSAAFGATFVAVFAVALHRSWKAVALVAAAHVTPVLLLWFSPLTTRQYVESVVFIVLVDATIIASGMLVRALRDRAGQAEEGQRLRIEEARRHERERIAREMHDVLAHRISLLAVHAGALEFRPDAPAEQVGRAVAVIRDSAYQALEELREVIGVLRDDRTDGERPQPTLADLPELVDESRRTGASIGLDNGIDDLDAVPAGVGRHAYRIVQEGLTNARKHAPHARVHVVVQGKPGDELTVELRNRLPGDAGPRLPGAGAGLIGLRERAGLMGGCLEHGRTPDGQFRLWASLPWPR